MFEKLRASRRIQLPLGLAFGIGFGFFLQKGGVTDYNVLMGQLLLTDFTVVKVMLTAVIVGMAGVETLRAMGTVKLHPKPGSAGSSLVGGLIFGVGFGLLGYCPGTMAGAVGEGRMDALMGGVSGALVGSWLFAIVYPWLERSILERGYFGELTFPELLKTKPWVVVIPSVLLLTGVLVILETSGL